MVWIQVNPARDGAQQTLVNSDLVDHVTSGGGEGGSILFWCDGTQMRIVQSRDEIFAMLKPPEMVAGQLLEATACPEYTAFLGQMLTERDAALKRVAEMESEPPEMLDPERLTEVLDSGKECAELRAELVATQNESDRREQRQKTAERKLCDALIERDEARNRVADLENALKATGPSVGDARTIGPESNADAWQSTPTSVCTLIDGSLVFSCIKCARSWGDDVNAATGCCDDAPKRGAPIGHATACRTDKPHGCVRWCPTQKQDGTNP